MRKRTISCLFDNIMWYLLYLLPLVVYLFVVIRTGNLLSLSSAMNTAGLGILESNVIFNSLNSLFGSAGVMPLFVSTDLLLYFSYFISVWLCHLAVDVLLFIVRLAHKFMDCFGGAKDE